MRIRRRSFELGLKAYVTNFIASFATIDVGEDDSLVSRCFHVVAKPLRVNARALLLEGQSWLV
jgi:hypothetical protein